MDYTHVKCIKEVSDDLGIYNYEGKIYEITAFFTDDDKLLIECEHVDGVDELMITLDDEDFEFLILEEE